MRGQGGAWSLVCGLWVPGDPQIQRSLPAACGALPRVTDEFPSCSWERIMESKSKIEVVGLKTPEVDQESKAVETNDPSTNGELELSIDSQDIEKYKAVTQISQLDHNYSKNPMTLEVEQHNQHQNTEPIEKRSSCAEELKVLTEIPEVPHMSCSEEMSSSGFCPDDVLGDEALAKNNEVRKERGLPELPERNHGSDSAKGISKLSPKMSKITSTSANEVSTVSEVNKSTSTVNKVSKSASVTVCSTDDDKKDSASSDLNTTKDKPVPSDEDRSKQTVSSKSSWVRHPDCKHTLEELTKMAEQIQTKKSRGSFLHKCYVRGDDVDVVLKRFLDMDLNKPRVALRKMSKILPKQLRTEFYCKAMKRKSNPQSLMRKYLSNPQNQQWLLCKRLRLTDSKLLLKVFKQPGNSNNPVCRPLKEWFDIFLQEGSVDEAIGKVKKLIIQGEVAGENTTGEIAPSDDAMANKSSGGGAAEQSSSGAKAQRSADEEKPKEVTSCQQFGKKSTARRNKKFQQLTEDQKKVYNSWMEQGLSHQDALSIVLRFPGDRKPTTPNVCAWGKCDKHQKPKFSKPPRTSTKAPPVANGALSSEPGKFKKPIFDRVPVPSIVLDDKSPLVAGLPLEAPVSGSEGIPIAPVSSSILPVPPSVPSTSSGIPPVSSVISPVTALAGSPHKTTDSCPLNGTLVTPVVPVLPGNPPLTTPSPTLAISSQGPRVPKKSTYVETPLKPAGQPEPTKALHLCIVPPGYPKTRFSDEEIDALENSMHVAISSISDERMKPIFKKQFRNGDKYELVCGDQLARKWLHKYVACMYPVLPLKIIPAEPTKIIARTVLPSCTNEESKKILSTFATQNSGLNVSRWVVVKRTDCEEKTSLRLLIDEESAMVLMNCSEVSFKTGTVNINVQDVDRLSDMASKTVSRQGPSGSAPTNNSDTSSSKNKMHVDPSRKDPPQTVDQKPSKDIGGRRRSSLEYSDSSNPNTNKRPEPNAGMGDGDSGYSHLEPSDCGPMNNPWYNHNAPGPGLQGYGMPPRFPHPPGMPPRFAHPQGMPPRFAHPSGMPPRFGHPPGMPPRFPHPPGMPPRFAHPPGMAPRFAHPPGMPPRFGHPPGMPPRFPYPPGMPPMFAHPMDGPPMYAHPGIPGFPEGPQPLDQTPSRVEKAMSRSPSPEFDELLKSARSRLNLPDEPTDTSKSSGEQPRQGRSRQRSRDGRSTKRTADRSSDRNDSPRTIPTANGSIKRSRSPQDSSYYSKSSSSDHRKQVRSQNPPHSAQSVKRSSERSSDRYDPPQKTLAYSENRSPPSIKRNRSPQGSYSSKSSMSVYANRDSSQHSAQSIKRATEWNDPPRRISESSESGKRIRSLRGRSTTRNDPSQRPPVSVESFKRTRSPQAFSYSSKSSSSEYPQLVPDAQPLKCTCGHPPPQRVPASSTSIRRNRSPEGSSRDSSSRRRKRSRTSPSPARTSKSSRRN